MKSEIMRNDKEKFHHSVSVLVKAYLDDTLQNMNCYACAVGNLVANACGYVFDVSNSHTFKRLVIWVGIPYPAINGWYDVIGHKRLTKPGLDQINSTGYSIEELSAIEEAFEETCDLDENPESIFNGLMAVVDVLADIHHMDLNEVSEAKSLFVRA